MLWNTLDGGLIHTIARNGINSLAFVPNGTLLLAGSTDAHVYVYNTTSGSLVQTLTLSNGSVNSIAVSSEYVAAASNGTVTLYYVNNLSVSTTLNLHDATINDVAFSHSGTLLATASADSRAPPNLNPQTVENPVR